MGVEILTYKSAEQLMLHDSLFSKYEDVIHITATNSLKKGIMEGISASYKSRWVTAPVLSFGQLTPFIGSKWFLSKTELIQNTRLSQIMREYAKLPDYNPGIFQAFDKNQDIVLRTMRSLVDAGYTSKEIRAIINNPTEEEQIFLSILQQLEKDKTFKSYANWFIKINMDPVVEFQKVVQATLNDLLNIDEDQMPSRLKFSSDEKRQQANILKGSSKNEIEAVLNNTFNKKKVIVFHGFYFITPVQKRIINALSSKMKVVHLIHYNEDCPNIFKTVERFLDIDKNGYLPVSKQSFPINIVANKFSKIIEGDFNESITLEGEKYFEFSHMYQFKEYVQQDADLLISPRAQEVRSYLDDIHSSSEVNLIDYPIGKFLLDVHQINNRDYNQAKRAFEDGDQLDTHILLRLFNSGYLFIEGQSAKKYVSDLEKIEPILAQCITFADWKYELNKLKELKIGIEQTLVSSAVIEKMDIEHESYAYVNRYLAYFNVSIEHIDMIEKGLEGLKTLYNRLFTGENISINNYMNELISYISKAIMPSLGSDGEIHVAEKVLSVLDELKDNDIDNVDRKDLISGLRYFLSQKSKVDESTEAPIDTNEPNSLQSPIISLQDADMIGFLENRSIHLAFMDNKALPMVQNVSLWPFKKKSLEALYKDNPFLNQIHLRKELSSDITSYLLYTMMQDATNVKFSIVKNLNDQHHLMPSFYIDLLDLRKSSTKITEVNEEPEIYNATIEHKTIQLLERKKTPLLEATLDKCRKRFVMSYLLKSQPDFKSDFHLSFVYRNLLQLFKLMQKDVPSVTEKETTEFISSWFPQWTDMKKKMLQKNAKNNTWSNQKFTYDDVNYFDNYNRIVLFGNKVSERDKQSSIGLATPGKHCMYCPFKLQCKESKLND